MKTIKLYALILLSLLLVNCSNDDDNNTTPQPQVLVPSQIQFTSVDGAISTYTFDYNNENLTQIANSAIDFEIELAYNEENQLISVHYNTEGIDSFWADFDMIYNAENVLSEVEITAASAPEYISGYTVGFLAEGLSYIYETNFADIGPCTLYFTTSNKMRDFYNGVADFEFERNNNTGPFANINIPEGLQILISSIENWGAHRLYFLSETEIVQEFNRYLVINQRDESNQMISTATYRYSDSEIEQLNIQYINLN